MTPFLETQIRLWCEEKTSDGWTSADRCVELATLIIERHALNIVEIGVFGGRSFIPQAMALNELRKSFGELGHIYGIDPMRKEPALEGENEANKHWWSHNVDLDVVHKKSFDAIWKYELQDHAILIRTCSQYCHQLFEGLDVLTIDGNHSEAASTRDAALYLTKVKYGGLVIVDDCDWVDDNGKSSTQKMQSIILESCEIFKDGGHYRIYKKTRK